MNPMSLEMIPPAHIHHPEHDLTCPSLLEGRRIRIGDGRHQSLVP